jgi:hypothetical protein
MEWSVRENNVKSCPQKALERERDRVFGRKKEPMDQQGKYVLFEGISERHVANPEIFFQRGCKSRR